MFLFVVFRRLFTTRKKSSFRVDSYMWYYRFISETRFCFFFSKWKHFGMRLKTRRHKYSVCLSSLLETELPSFHLFNPLSEIKRHSWIKSSVCDWLRRYILFFNMLIKSKRCNTWFPCFLLQNKSLTAEIHDTYAERLCFVHVDCVCWNTPAACSVRQTVWLTDRGVLHLVSLFMSAWNTQSVDSQHDSNLIQFRDGAETHLVYFNHKLVMCQFTVRKTEQDIKLCTKLPLKLQVTFKINVKTRFNLAWLKQQTDIMSQNMPHEWREILFTGWEAQEFLSLVILAVSHTVCRTEQTQSTHNMRTAVNPVYFCR